MLVLTAVSATAGLSKLDALSMIETGNDDSAVGRAGEVSRFQIRPRIWRQYTQSRDYGNRRVASTVAQQHLTYLEEFFRARAGREATDFDIYVLWNAGPTYYERAGFLPERVNRAVRERAQRYLNLRNIPLSQQVLYAARTK